MCSKALTTKTKELRTAPGVVLVADVDDESVRIRGEKGCEGTGGDLMLFEDDPCGSGGGVPRRIEGVSGGDVGMDGGGSCGSITGAVDCSSIGSGVCCIASAEACSASGGSEGICCSCLRTLSAGLSSGIGSKVIVASCICAGSSSLTGSSATSSIESPYSSWEATFSADEDTV